MKRITSRKKYIAKIRAVKQEFPRTSIFSGRK
jgi:hypothetical protein